MKAKKMSFHYKPVLEAQVCNLSYTEQSARAA